MEARLKPGNEDMSEMLGEFMGTPKKGTARSVPLHSASEDDDQELIIPWEKETTDRSDRTNSSKSCFLNLIPSFPFCPSSRKKMRTCPGRQKKYEEEEKISKEINFTKLDKKLIDEDDDEVGTPRESVIGIQCKQAIRKLLSEAVGKGK